MSHSLIHPSLTSSYPKPTNQHITHIPTLHPHHTQQPTSHPFTTETTTFVYPPTTRSHRRVTAREDARTGTTDIAPLRPAIVGLLTGIAATTIDLPTTQTVAMALLVSYPTVMLTAVGLLVAVRSLLYSRSPATTSPTPPRDGRGSAILWTPVDAFAIERDETRPPPSTRTYDLGTALPL